MRTVRVDIGRSADSRVLPTVLIGYRALYGLDLYDVSERTGVRQSALAALEAGRLEPTPDVLWQLAGAYAGESGPNLWRWQVLLAAAFLSWPTATFFGAVVGRPEDAGVVWRRAGGAEAVWSQAARAPEETVGPAGVLWTAYLDDGQQMWPRFSSACRPHWNAAAQQTAWFEVAWLADATGRDALARILTGGARSDRAEEDWEETAAALWEVWTRRGRHVPDPTASDHPDPERFARLEACWKELTPPYRAIVVGLARALLGQ